MNQNNVWTLVSLPEGKKAIDSRWHLRVKYGPDGELKRYKAKFVAMGFSQREGVFYKETFSLTARLSTVRVVLCLVAQVNWCVKQQDIKTAFLIVNVEKENHMKQAEVFEVSSSPGDVLICKL